MDDWSKFIDNEEPVDVLYMDFRKAFDSVPYKRLIHKLRELGIVGNILSWITDFLCKRQQRVCVNGVFSEWSKVTSGVPQGSVIGPILFVLFVNDIPEIVNSQCQMFADDCKIYDCVNSLDNCETIQNDIHALCEWTSKWLLFFNSAKCKTLHIGRRNPDHEYTMSDKNDITVVLENTDCEKDLGVHFQQNLKFSKHINTTVNKANQRVGLLKRSFKYLDRNLLLIIYKTIGDLYWTIARAYGSLR